MVVIPKKPPPEQPYPPTEFRNLAISEEELTYLFGISKRAFFPQELFKRMTELADDFRDQGLKLKEITARAKANAFWTEKTTADLEIKRLRKANKEDREKGLAELKILTAKELRPLLDKQKIANRIAKRLAKRNAQREAKRSD